MSAGLRTRGVRRTWASTPSTPRQVGLTAVNAIARRSATEDTIRVHPDHHPGGFEVNVIRGEVRLETYVRGRTVDAILDAQKKVDRSVQRRAPSRWERRWRSRRCPATCDGCDQTMARHHEANAGALVGAEHYRQIGHPYGLPTGRAQHGMRSLHPYVGAATGSGHGADYKDRDPQLAYVTNAKALAGWPWTCWPTAPRERASPQAAKPPMTREHTAFQRGLARPRPTRMRRARGLDVVVPAD